jgi:hypothetical protein
VLDLKDGNLKEVEQQEENGIVNIMKSRGLGDDIAKFTKITGIKRVVDRVSEGLNIPCGCEGRQKAMNALFPYKNKNN